MTTETSTNLFELSPSVTLRNPHESTVISLVELNDGSFLSGSDDVTAKRWLRTTNNNTLELLGTYLGHTCPSLCAIEKDDDTLLTGSFDDTLRVWNTTTCECLDTFSMYSSVRYLLKTKDNSRIVCGFGNGRVDIRRVSDLAVLSSFRIDRGHQRVGSICELLDGSFVSTAFETMQSWDIKGRVLQTFLRHSDYINRVIELNRDIVVSASDDKTVKMWKVATGECLRTLTLHSDIVRGLAKLSDSLFASGSFDGRIVVWDEKGDCVETHQSKSGITAMTRLKDGSIVTADRYLIEIRQL